jgi:hypothetical protein
MFDCPLFPFSVLQIFQPAKDSARLETLPESAACSLSLDHAYLYELMIPIVKNRRLCDLSFLLISSPLMAHGFYPFLLCLDAIACDLSNSHKIYLFISKHTFYTLTVIWQNTSFQQLLQKHCIIQFMVPGQNYSWMNKAIIMACNGGGTHSNLSWHITTASNMKVRHSCIFPNS